MKGLIANIYRSDYGDCSRDGVSNRYERVTIVGEDLPEIFEPSDEAPAVFIDSVNVGGKDYYHLKPIEAKTDGKWYMAGGCFVSTSDSRFPFDYPVPLHDRIESGRSDVCDFCNGEIKPGELIRHYGRIYCSSKCFSGVLRRR